MGVAGADCETVTVVEINDSCTAIANRTGISFSLLLTNNPNINADCTNIEVGEVRYVLRDNAVESDQGRMLMIMTCQVLCTANVTIPYNSTA